VTSRLPTSSYPDNARSEWVTRPTAPLRLEGGLYRFGYGVWPTQRSLDQGDKPFVIHGHIAQIRETHQRIRLNALGELMHVTPGPDIPPDAVEEFLANDPRAYRWLTPWQDDRGRRLQPFMFPTYQGQPEALDPQWLRDRFVVPLDQQIQELIAGQLISDEIHHWTGDRSHTTWDLQVGASADDVSRVAGLAGWTTSGVGAAWGHATAITELGVRFTNVTITVGSTIDVAYWTWTVHISRTTTGNVEIYGDDEANAATFSTAADFDARPRTTALQTYTVPASPTLNVEYSTNSLISPIQEVIDLGTWASGNALALITKDVFSGSDFLSNQHYYDGDTTKAPKLHIEATEGGGGRVMGALAGHGGLASGGGLVGRRGGIAG